MAAYEDILTTTFRVVGVVELTQAYNNASRVAQFFGVAERAAAAAQLETAMKAAATAGAQQILAVQMAASASTASEMKLAMLALTVAEDAATVATEGLAAAETAASAAEWAMLGPLALILVAILAITAAVAGAAKALGEFANEQRKVFSAQAVFRNLGLDPSGLRPAIDQISRRTTAQRPELFAAAERFAEVGLQPKQINQGLEAAANLAALHGKTVEQTSSVIEKAIEGQTRGLKDYGITLQDTGSRAANFALVMQQIDLRARGAGEAFKNSLPGAIDDLHKSMQHLFSVIGERLAPAAVRVLNFMASVMDFIADHIDAIITLVSPVLAGVLALIGKKAEAKAIMEGAASRRLASESTLQEVADNTKQAADSIETAILGGAGTVARESFGYLQGRLAMAI